MGNPTNMVRTYVRLVDELKKGNISVTSERSPEGKVFIQILKIGEEKDNVAQGYFADFDTGIKACFRELDRRKFNKNIRVIK